MFKNFLLIIAFCTSVFSWYPVYPNLKINDSSYIKKLIIPSNTYNGSLTFTTKGDSLWNLGTNTEYGEGELTLQYKNHFYWFDRWKIYPNYFFDLHYDSLYCKAIKSINGYTGNVFSDSISSRAVKIAQNLDVYGNLNWNAGNVIFVPLDSSIQNYINKVPAGTTLILASGEKTITSTITINKQVNIIGQGHAGTTTIPVTATHGTLLKSSTNYLTAFQINNSNVRIADMSINLTGAASTGINTANNLEGIVIHNIDMIVTCTGLAQGFTIYGSNAVLRDLSFFVTSTNTASSGLWAWNDASTMQNSIIDCFGVTGTVQGAGTYSYSFVVENINTSKSITMNLSNSVCKSISGTPLDAAVAALSTTTNNSVINAYFCTFDGADYDAYCQGTNIINLGGSVLVNKKISGNVTYRLKMVAGVISSDSAEIGSYINCPILHGVADSSKGTKNLGGGLCIPDSFNCHGTVTQKNNSIGVNCLAPDALVTVQARTGTAYEAMISLKNNSGGSIFNFIYDVVNSLLHISNRSSVPIMTIKETSNNVGIGVTPSYKLDVNGDVNIAAGSAYKINGTNATYSDFAAAPATHGVTANYLSKSLTANTWGNSLLYDNGTYVGVGLTNSTYNFCVNGYSVTNNRFIVTNDVTSGASRKTINLCYDNASTPAYARFFTYDYGNNVDLPICINQYGGAGAYVSIGKLSPGYMLDINGDCNLSSGYHYKINGANLTYTDVGAFSATHGVATNYLVRATSTTALGNSLLQDNGNEITTTSSVKSDVWYYKPDMWNNTIRGYLGYHGNIDSGAGITGVSSSTVGYAGRFLGTVFIDGFLYMEFSGGGYYSTSDHQWHNGSSKNIKKDITDNKMDLNKLLDSIKIKNYHYKEQDKPGMKAIGFIAEETPALLSGEKHDGQSTANCIGFLLAVVKDQKSKISILENNQKIINKRIDSLLTLIKKGN